MVSIIDTNFDIPTDLNNILSQLVFEKKLKNIEKEDIKKENIKNEKDKKQINKEYINKKNQKNQNFKDNINNIDNVDILCNDCNSRYLVELDGFYVCKKCGLYNDCIISSGQEWRNYGAEDSKGNDQSRCDIPTNDLLPKTSIGSLVGFSTRENKTSKRIRNMNYWNAIPYRESSLLETFNNITIMSQNSGINQCIIEDAKSMYKKVTDIKSSRRTKKEAMKAGCVMLACKLKGVPRNCSEIAKIFKLKNNKTFRKSIKTFEEIWNNIQLSENGITTKIKLELNQKNKKTINDDDSSNDDSDSSDSSDSSNSSDSSDSSDSSNSDSSDNSSDSDLEENTYQYINKNKNISTNTNNKNANANANANIKNDIKAVINDCKTECKTIIDIKNNDKSIITSNIPNDTISINSIETINKINTNQKTSKILQDCITKLHRFSCILGFDDKIFEACRIILTYIENEKYLDKHTPLSRTSAVIYYIIERLNITNINKHQILQTCEVSDVTINKCYQKIMKYKKEMLQINIGM